MQLYLSILFLMKSCKVIFNHNKDKGLSCKWPMGILLWLFLALLWKHLNSFYFNNGHKNQRDKVSIFVPTPLWFKLYNTVRILRTLVWFSMTPNSALFHWMGGEKFSPFPFSNFFSLMSYCYLCLCGSGLSG